ncbi:MAG: hypothetical protein NVS4B8_26100 [Herpetosiphon sp.]
MVKAIKTETEYDAALARVEELLDMANKGPRRKPMGLRSLRCW